MKVKTALVILFSILILGLIGLGFIYKMKNSQLADEAVVPKQEDVQVPVKVLTNDEKEEIGKARAAELLRMMDDASSASSTPLTEEEKAAKIKEGEARAAELLKMMK